MSLQQAQLEWHERPIDTIAFDEESEKSIDVPRDNPIRRIMCEFYVEFVNGTSPVETDDGLLELLENIKLQMDGKDLKFSKSGRQWFYLEKDDKKTAPYRTTFTTTNSATHTEKVVLIHDFASDPLDRQDITALLPAQRMSSLKLIANFGSASDVSTNISSITDANSGINVEIREVSGTVDTGNGVIDIGSMPFADIREDAKVDGIPASKTSFDTSTFKVDVTPAPANILKNLFIVLDSDVRSNAFITDIKIQKEKGGKKTLIHRKWNMAWAERKTEQGLESVTTGILVFDYVDIFGGGLVNRGNEGDVRYRFLTGASTEATDNLEIVSRYITLEGN